MGDTGSEVDLKAQEALWVDLARKGDREAFGKIVERHMKSAYYTALAIVRSPEDAMELSQDAFLRAFCAMNRFEKGASFYPWFHRILRNVCFTHLKKRKRRLDNVPIDREAGEWEFPSKEMNPSEIIEREELEQQVWLKLGQLGEADREILFLKEFKGLSYADIADALEIPLGTVMSRLYNARKRLREKMAEYLEGNE